MPEPEQIFETTATLVNGVYYHFGIIRSLCSMYGVKESEVQDLKFKISVDQERRNTKGQQVKEKDYWGWYDFKQQRFSLIYPAYFLLNMCFPNGIEASEEASQGKAYRLYILEN